MNTDQNNLSQFSNTLENKQKKKDSVDKRIILQITSAYGFSLVKGFIVIHATLMNKKLLTPIIPVVKNELKITSQLIWSINDADLKSLKMSNTSIKVECFHQPKNKLSSNERLGYLLLKLRGAQTINRTSNDRIDYTSYKLIGTRNCCYDFTISLRIEDICDTTSETPHNLTSQKLKMINNKNINDDKSHIDKDELKNQTEKTKEPKLNLKKQEEKIIELEKNINIHDETTKLYVDKENDQFKKNNERDSPKYNVHLLEQTEYFPKENEVQNAVTFDVQQKIIEELEDWKDKQKILFYEKMKTKEDNLLKEFNKKWFEDRKRIEDELRHNISKCKTFADNMDEMADRLKERETIITAKELEMASQKNIMDDKYKSFIKNMQLCNTQKNNELQNKITELETKLRNSEKIIILLNKENEQLKDDLNTNCSLQLQQLEKTILNLESKYEESEKSSMFYKERWISSVRKINQMATKLYGNRGNERILNCRQNTQSILTNQSIERQHDEEILRTLLNDLANLRKDMTNINYAT